MSNVIAFDPRRPRRPRPAARPATSAEPKPQAAGTPLRSLLTSWMYALDEGGKSPYTLKNYGDTLRAFIPWLEENGHPTDSEGVNAEHIRLWLIHETNRTSLASAAARYRGLRVFWGWVIREKERTTESPMTNVDPIRVPKKARSFFDDDQLRAMLAACSGGPLFVDRRDTAILRIFMDIGVRVSGMANLRYHPEDEDLSDVRLSKKRLRVRLKGGEELWVPLGKKATVALDRYIRVRDKHPEFDSPWLWLGLRGTGRAHMNTSGIRQMVARRGEQAGVQGAHPHRFRRTFADDYLEGGGSVDGLMAIAGWSSYQMPQLYAGERAAERARQAHDRLSPGDRI